MKTKETSRYQSIPVDYRYAEFTVQITNIAVLINSMAISIAFGKVTVIIKSTTLLIEIDLYQKPYTITTGTEGIQS